MSALVVLITYLHHNSITSYGERENRYEEVAEYFRAHFAQIHKRKGVQKQELYIVCICSHLLLLLCNHILL